MNVSTNVVPIAPRRLERTAPVVARNRRCGPEARRRRALLFVAGLVVLSAVLAMIDRQATERTANHPAATLSGST